MSKVDISFQTTMITENLTPISSYFDYPFLSHFISVTLPPPHLLISAFLLL